MKYLRFVVRLAARHLRNFLATLRFYSLTTPNLTETLLDKMEAEANEKMDR
jgi:hypothetical protein